MLALPTLTADSYIDSSAKRGKLEAGNRRRSDDEHYTLIVGHRRILFYHSCRYLLLTQHFCRIHLHCAALAENDRSEFMTQVEAYVLEQQLAVIAVADGIFRSK